MKFQYWPYITVIIILTATLWFMWTEPAPAPDAIQLPLRYDPEPIRVPMTQAKKPLLKDEAQIPAHVWAVARGSWNTLDSCHESRKASSRNYIYGALDLRFVINEKGKVEQIETLGPNSSDRELVRCIEDSLQRWHFYKMPKPTNVRWDINWDRDGR